MKVSVCMITFNHEKFIAQAIEGFLAQKTTFDIELVIADDCSTDDTGAIIDQYKKENSNKIKILSREKNLGAMNNFLDTINNCNGEYIALCEGDDYWIDPYKLQKQINFLNDNPEYSICSHNVQVVQEGSDNLPIEWLGRRDNEDLTLEDLLRDGSGGATCSLVFRNNIFGDFPTWYMEQKGGDWTLQILCATKGKMKYFSEVMGVYRIHSGGSIVAAIKEAKKNKIDTTAIAYKNTLQIIDALDKHFKFRYSRILNLQKVNCYEQIFKEYLNQGCLSEACRYGFKLKSTLFIKSLNLYYRTRLKNFVKRYLVKWNLS